MDSKARRRERAKVLMSDGMAVALAFGMPRPPCRSGRVAMCRAYFGMGFGCWVMRWRKELWMVSRWEVVGEVHRVEVRWVGAWTRMSAHNRCEIEVARE